MRHCVVMDQTTTKKIIVQNTAGNGENGGNQHLLLFPQCFLPYQGQILSLEVDLPLYQTTKFWIS